MTPRGFEIPLVFDDFDPEELTHTSWDFSGIQRVTLYWNAEPGSAARQFEARSLWSERHLYFRFEAVLSDEIVMSPEPRTDVKTIGLWERDVCEIFIAPDRNEPRKYFEFEVAPTGEWLDLAIDMTGEERITDWDYHSGMEAAARIEDDRVLMSMKIPWEAFGRKPKPGDIWLGNIFRCVGSGPGRGYLAWKPTMTEKPNFHVPDKFGELIFEN